MSQPCTCSVHQDSSHRCPHSYFHPGSDLPNQAEFGQQYPYAPGSQGAEAGMVMDWAAPDNLNYDQFMWESSGEFLDPVYPPASDQPEMTFPLPSENSDPCHSSSLSTAGSLGPGTPSSVDTAGRSWRCDECNKEFRRNSELQRHLQTTLKHAVRRHLCHRCRKSYTRKDTLKSHKCEPK